MNNKDYLLHGVRGIQQYLAIVSEILILLAFFTSGMDISVGGTMAGIPFLKWGWALVFALGIDTAFVVSWVRVRRPGRPRNLWWCVPVALGMSFVVWQPVAVQLLQQALDIGFQQALSMLGVNLVLLTYGRATIAVVLGAVLALTNVEQSNAPQSNAIKRLYPWQRLVDKYAPIVIEQAPQTPIEQKIEQQREEPIEQETHIEQEDNVVEKPALKVVENTTDKIKQALVDDPTLTNRAIARRLKIAPSTIGVHRKKIEQQAM